METALEKEIAFNSSARALEGEIDLPADKSISHRGIILGSVATGVSSFRARTLGRDNLATVRAMRQLGVSLTAAVPTELFEIAVQELKDVECSNDGWCRLRIDGCGFDSFRRAEDEIDCGNSGTSARLLTGLLAGLDFPTRMTGDESLRRRPFKRVIEPLTEMGASFSADLLPFTVTGGTLTGIDFISTQPSAQVKSAVLLAGLQANGATSVTEALGTRDHTERMLCAMGVPLSNEALDGNRQRLTIAGNCRTLTLKPFEMTIPGDFSAAAFFIVAALVYPGSNVLIRGTGFNETRNGLFYVLKRMGADLRLSNQREEGGETVVDIQCLHSPLHGTTVTPEEVILSIDEIPILSVAAALAEGETLIEGAGELRVKESDRLSMIAALLRSFAINVSEGPESLRIVGRPQLADGRPHFASSDAAKWRLSGDHRIAMSGALLELLVSGKTVIQDQRAIETSFPGFCSTLAGLLQ